MADHRQLLGRHLQSLLLADSFFPNLPLPDAGRALRLYHLHRDQGRSFSPAHGPYCANWLLAPFLLFLASVWWYIQALPEPQRAWIATFSPELAPFLTVFLWDSPLLFLGGLIMVIRLPRTATRSLAVILLLLGITYLGAFEYIREGSRRPFTLVGHIYANSILVNDLETVRAQGILASAKWVNKEITEENRLMVGRQLFNIMCSPCHSVGGPMRDIKKLSAKYDSASALEAGISGQGKLNLSMPPFPGTDQERRALAAFIMEGLHGRKDQAAPPVALKAPPLAPLPFDQIKDGYVLLAWNNLGMHSISDADGSFSLMPPANNLFAQLIRRGPTPEIVTEGVVLSYQVEPGFEKPASQVEFWKYLPSLFGLTRIDNTGLSGQGLAGVMQRKKEGKTGAARLMQHLKPTGGATLAEIKPRTPWLQQPDCLTCHANFGPPEADSAFGVWTAGGEDLYRNRHDESGSIHCVACHGSPHAEYPAGTPYEKEQDNFGPRQYQGNPYPLAPTATARSATPWIWTRTCTTPTP